MPLESVNTPEAKLKKRSTPTDSMSLGLLLSSLIITVTLTGCTTSPWHLATSQDQKLEQLLRDTVTEQPANLTLYLSPEIISELDAKINQKWTEVRRLQALRELLFSETGRKISYDSMMTRTALETWEAGLGNCLSISHLFVAAARHLNIDAHLKTVSVSPTWDQQGLIMIRYEHIVAVGELSNGDDYVIDLLPELSSDSRDSKVIDDLEALSHHYNNLGAESVIEGDYPRAILGLLKAIKLTPEFSDAWNNIGAAYRRNGEIELAEASYHKSLRLDRNNYSALGNLTQLYLSQGRQDEAKQFISQVNRYYRRNPYFHYYIAQLRFRSGDYQDAIKYLKGAVKLKPFDPEFYDALAESYRRIGKESQAKAATRMAEKIRKQEDRLRLARRHWTQIVRTR